MKYQKVLNIISKVLEINEYDLDLDSIVTFLDVKYNKHIQKQEQINKIQCEKKKFSNDLSKIYELRLEEEKCFKEISKSSILSENYIRENEDKLNWVLLSKWQRMSEDFMREFQDKLHWKNITRHQEISDDFMCEFEDKIDWRYLAKDIHNGFSEKLFRKINSIAPELINWKEISKEKLSENFIREFKDKVHWGNISEYQELTDDFIDEFADVVNWRFISSNRFPSAKLYSKYISRIYWGYIYKYELPEDFIKQFECHMCWNKIAMRQQLSENLIIEKWDAVSWLDILQYQILSESFLRKLIEMFAINPPKNFNPYRQDLRFGDDEYRNNAIDILWKYISNCQKLSEDFIREFQDVVCWNSIYNFQILSNDFSNEFKYKIKGCVLFDLYSIGIYCTREKYFNLAINKIQNFKFKYFKTLRSVKKIQRNFREKIYHPDHVFVLKANLHFLSL